ncbi:hypothetical protein MWU59_11910 [Flavobacteriaceae bacterium F08102]|nr:hypothetical protein [Flavobacteriaceae bacterium F08102]
MKKLIAGIILLLSLQAQGQRMSNQYYSGNHQANSLMYTRYNAEREAGILRYDIEEVLKKLKIKPTDTKAEKITSLLKSYDAKIENIQLMYRATFTEMDLVVEAKKTEMRSSNNPDLYQDLQEYISKNLKPVQAQVTPHVLKLNEEMQTILTAKQLQKWLKLQKKLAQKSPE